MHQTAENECKKSNHWTAPTLNRSTHQQSSEPPFDMHQVTPVAHSRSATGTWAEFLVCTNNPEGYDNKKQVTSKIKMYE